MLSPKASFPSDGLWETVGSTGSGGAALLFVFIAFGVPLLHWLAPRWAEGCRADVKCRAPVAWAVFWQLPW